jgi:homoserine acetyltransferase
VSVEWAKVSSAKGHDAFLTEPALFDGVLRRALA